MVKNINKLKKQKDVKITEEFLKNFEVEIFL